MALRPSWQTGRHGLHSRLQLQVTRTPSVRRQVPQQVSGPPNPALSHDAGDSLLDTDWPVYPTERLSAREQKPQSLAFSKTTLKRCKSAALSTEERLASLRCRSGQGVSTSASNNSNQPESNGSSAEEPAKPTRHAHERSSSWMRMFLTLPLELATVTARTDKFYLRKRKRKHWWSREHFPTVC